MNIHIAILTWNRLADFEKCLYSLDNSILGRYNVKAYVLDNGSDKETVDFVKNISTYVRASSQVVHQESKTNLGVAGGRDALLRWINPAQDDIVIFLDSDTLITDNDWLDKITVALNKEEVGIVGCAGSFVDWSLPYLFVPANSPCKVDVVAGWCFAFKAALLNLGMALDKEYGLFFEEDADLCLQAMDLGWDVIALGNIGVQHHPGNSAAHLVDRSKTFARFTRKWKNKGLVKMEGWL